LFLPVFDDSILPMSVSKVDVKYIAALARIDVPEDKLEGFTKSLSGIVQYVEQLQKLDVDNVKPTTHAVPVGNVLRPDVIKPSLTNQEALSFAVEAKDGSFKVPLVIE
jgi:aspartyl-tRNA(Asn)/glutamyl-tRNA(Gln) amidotransferase subunit C